MCEISVYMQNPAVSVTTYLEDGRFERLHIVLCLSSKIAQEQSKGVGPSLNFEFKLRTRVDAAKDGLLSDHCNVTYRKKLTLL